MDKLSNTGKAFLDKHTRDQTTVDRIEIIDFFKSNNIPVFGPVIEFQTKYSGYTFFAGLEPITFRIIQGEGGLPFSNKTAYVEFEEICANRYLFACATTEYQMKFEIDELGQYYEDNECVASCFEKVVEELALREYIAKIKDIEVTSFHITELKANYIELLGLNLLENQSDTYTQWYNNSLIYLKRRRDSIELFMPTNIELLNIIRIEKNYC